MSKSCLSPNWSRPFRRIDLLRVPTHSARQRGSNTLAEHGDLLSMQRQNLDEDLTLLTDVGKTEAIDSEVTLSTVLPA